MQTDVVKPQPSQPASTTAATHEANRWVEDALIRDKQESLALAVRARWISLAVIAVLLPFINPRLEVIYYEVILGLFALIGWLQLKIGRVGRSRAELALIFCDLALMTVTLTMPNPISTADWPWPMQYRFQNFIYFYVSAGGRGARLLLAHCRHDGGLDGTSVVGGACRAVVVLHPGPDAGRCGGNRVCVRQAHCRSCLIQTRFCWKSGFRRSWFS